MWQDALRVAKEYLPHMLPEVDLSFMCWMSEEERMTQVEAAYDEQQLKSGAKGAASYVAQAQEWEESADYDRAIDCYLKVSIPSSSTAPRLSLSRWRRR